MLEATSHPHILLVEDNPHDADLTRIGFKRNQVALPIVHISNGEDALAYLFATGKYEGGNPRELPLAVILDLKLPKVSGLEVLRSVRDNERTRQLPVLILSSSSEAQDTAACRALGVTAYVQKPVSFLEFDQAVKHMARILTQLGEQSPSPMQ